MLGYVSKAVYYIYTWTRYIHDPACEREQVEEVVDWV